MALGIAGYHPNGRATTVNATFRAFTGAIRAAVVRLEAAQAPARTAR
ncbi:hypothetical protein [Streptomyces sp. NPDC058953]